MHPPRAVSPAADARTDEHTTAPEVVRRRCTAGLIAGGAVYAAAFTIDIVRHTPSDDSIVMGLEILAAAAMAVCLLITVLLWALGLAKARTDAERADEVAFTYAIAGQVADTFPRQRPAPGGDRALR